VGEERPSTSTFETLAALREERQQATAGKNRIANLQIVVPLIDEHMIADPSWRWWLEHLGHKSASHRRRFMPVALHPSAFSAPEPLCRLNFLRPYDSRLGDPKASREESRERMIRSLLKQLTESLCRMLRAERGAALSTAASGLGDPVEGWKVKIFLSHAKVDGAGPARRIRDYVYSQTQLAVFYDENDIAFGSAYAEVIRKAVAPDQAAAMIAVRTAGYAERPWCRRELSLFRRPVQESVHPDENAGAGTIQRWRLHPVMVVDALEPTSARLERGTDTNGIPELGNAPVIRWKSEVPDQEELVVTTMLRDALLGEFHATLGRTIVADPGCDSTIVINWSPDPVTLLQIPYIREGRSVAVYYPGRGLSGMEIDMLVQYFPEVELRSFEEVHG
jgi:hypothetical protein